MQFLYTLKNLKLPILEYEYSYNITKELLFVLSGYRPLLLSLETN